MSFIADKQTLDDLNLLGKFRPNSVYGVFNKIKTAGGERLLDNMFHNPMIDADAINKRSSVFRFFQDKKITFPFSHEQFSLVENYLESDAGSNALSIYAGMGRKKIMNAFLRDEQYNTLQTGLVTTIRALQIIKELFNTLDIELVQPANAILNDNRLSWLSEVQAVQPLPFVKAAKYDHLLRGVLRHEMERVLDTLYQLDVFVAVSDVAREKEFSYARALPAAQNCFRATALRHPGLNKAVSNPLAFTAANNVLFLTGANMAGKSTFMKSFGIAVYLAHMGFPVAAGDMEFSVRDGLYSSINVPDNIALGYSHFYAEVLRVKQVAEAVSSGKNIVVVFDELFKGTNVKDAYDATLAVTAAFSQYHRCVFIVSTHIIEVGAALHNRPNLQFAYLPTIMEGAVPRYTYRLTEGITNDRHGMIIIENENIIDIIQASNS
ncbi:DNA mismatch repair protein [Niastella yeongjuensis]|uniref:DNA mismatch repair protein n=1 Tax=Niastella yeongjuensis TaxID=354355 RepID=A0A1V9EEY0_9BACT|nr:DNA mismatch repair protein [Niastella yeongjuensis]OQP44514.1 DNA mismatch repair protein [Niastella yeongjuensis]SEO85036.1 MutS domain III [Niastella yeongjuensis]